MKKLSYLFALLFLASTIFIACGSDNDDPTPEPPIIEVPDREELEQTVYADEEEGESGVRFTTVAPWTSSVRDVRSATETAIDDVETRSTGHWLTLTPSSGGAGSHMVALTLEPNLTGEDRTAVISINSAGTVLEISITQQGVRGDGTIPVASVTLCVTTTTLAVGNTKTFTATVTPENATNTNVLWSSNNHVVAIVNADGMVTAVSEGTAQITALSQDGNHTAIVEVTVVPVSVTGVTLNKNDMTITIGNMETLIATIQPSDAANQAVTWSSSNPLVASVNEWGNVTALSVGEAIITVITDDGEYYDTCVVTVVPTPATGVTLVGRTTATLAIGGIETFIATVIPFPTSNQNMTWTSSDLTVATLNSTIPNRIVIVTAVSAGTATITGTTEDGDFTVTATVRVASADDVFIGGAIWATHNVGAPGTFTENPEDAGMFFQWNSPIGFSTTNPLLQWRGNQWVSDGWLTYGGRGMSWDTARSDPCPEGWRVPTMQELHSLNSAGSIWTTRNGVDGRLFGTAPNQIFLPAAGTRDPSPFIQQVYSGRYWSSTGYDYNSDAFFLRFDDESSNVNLGSFRAWGQSVRCVAK